MHRIFSMLGQLDCCARVACGKTHFGPGHCPLPSPVDSEVVPKCMTLIRPADVVSAVEYYYRGRVALPARVGRADALFKRLNLVNEQEKHLLYGAVVGDLRGKLSSQLLLGHPALSLTIICSWKAARLIDCPSVLPNRPQRFFDSAKAQMLYATDFASYRCQVLDESPQEALNKIEDRSLTFAFFDNNDRCQLSKDSLLLWSKKVVPGGILGGSCYNNEEVTNLVMEYSHLKELEVMLDKEHTWFFSN